SQGFGVAEQRGENVEYFVHVAGKPAKRDMFEALDLGWTRYGSRAGAYVRALANAKRALERDHPDRALGPLVTARGALDRLPDDARVRDARQALDELLAAAAGLYARATAASATAVPGDNVEVTLELVARGAAVTVRRVEVGGVTSLAKSTPLALGDKKLVTARVALPANTPPTLPYWLAQPAHSGRYEVPDARLIGAPLGPPPLSAIVDVVIAGRAIRLVRPVVYAWTDPVHGERVRPFVIVP